MTKLVESNRLVKLVIHIGFVSIESIEYWWNQSNILPNEIDVGNSV